MGATGATGETGATGPIGPSGSGNYIQSVHTASGIFDTEEKIQKGLKAIKVTVLGGGGSTSELPASTELKATSGGGAGGMAIKYWTVSELKLKMPFTVGSSGGTTSFGIEDKVITATGGNQNGGGVGFGGDINVQGQSGSPGNTNGLIVRGGGGNSIYGAGAPISYGPGSSIYPIIGYGAGAGGVASSADISCF
jgi:hypothetical protein